MRTFYKKSGLIFLLLSLSLINIFNGIAQESNDVGNIPADFPENSDEIPDNSDIGQNGIITNSVNQTASPSTSTSNQSDTESILDNARIGSLEEDFNPSQRDKTISELLQ
jgi:hypothetical protein